MSEPTEQPVPAADTEDVPRVHSEDPAEGPDPGDDAEDVPRVHDEDPVEGAPDLR